jgi:hypothetical protein
MLDRLCHIGIGREMHDGVNARKCRERSVLVEIGFNQFETGRQTPVTARQIVIKNRSINVPAQSARAALLPM